MPTITCPECAEEHNINDATWAKIAGKSVKCRGCGQSFTARAESVPPPITRQPLAAMIDTSEVAQSIASHAKPVHPMPNREGLQRLVDGLNTRIRLAPVLGVLVLLLGVGIRVAGDPLSEIYEQATTVIGTGFVLMVLGFLVGEWLRRQKELLEIQMNMERLLVAIANNTTPRN